MSLFLGYLKQSIFSRVTIFGPSHSILARDHIEQFCTLKTLMTRVFSISNQSKLLT